MKGNVNYKELWDNLRDRISKDANSLLGEDDEYWEDAYSYYEDPDLRADARKLYSEYDRLCTVLSYMRELEGGNGG